jgi:polysaccharide deacetylase 2 family uncharacterized protein YibQ
MILLHEANTADIFESRFNNKYPEYAAAMESLDLEYGYDETDLEFESVFGTTDDDFLTESEKSEKFKKWITGLPAGAINGLIKAYQTLARLVKSVIIDMTGFYKLDGKSIKKSIEKLGKKTESEKKPSSDTVRVALYSIATNPSKFAMAKSLDDYIAKFGTNVAAPEDSYKAAINVVDFNLENSGNSRKITIQEVFSAIATGTKPTIDGKLDCRSIVFVRTAEKMEVAVIGVQGGVSKITLDSTKTRDILKNLDTLYNAAKADKTNAIKDAHQYVKDEKKKEGATEESIDAANKGADINIKGAKAEYAVVAGALKAICTGMMRFSGKYKPVTYDKVKEAPKSKEKAKEGEAKTEDYIIDLDLDASITFEAEFGSILNQSAEEYSIESTIDWMFDDDSDYTTEGVLSTKVRNLFKSAFGTLDSLFSQGGAVTISRKAIENLKAKFGDMPAAKNNKRYQYMLYGILATALEKRDAKLIGELYKAQKNHTEYRWVLDNYEKIDLSKNSYTIRFGVYDKDANIYWPAIKAFISGGENDENLESTVAKKMSGTPTVGAFFMTNNEGAVVFSVVDASGKVDTFEADKNFVKAAKKSAVNYSKTGGETLAAFGVMFGRFLAGLKGGRIGVKAVEATKEESTNESVEPSGDLEAFNALFA